MSARAARLADWLAFLLPALLAASCGWRAHGHKLADLETLAAARKAWEVFHLQDHANLALLGFDQPPLLALLHLPAAVFAPGLLADGLVGPLLGALFLGLSTLVLARLGRALGLPGWALALVVGLFAWHPLVLGWAALGARAMPLAFVFLGLAASLVLWAKTGRVRDLVTGGLLAAAAILLAYEALAIVVAAAALVAWRSRGGTAPARAEGTLIAFLLPAAYVAAVWVLADWIIMGDFGHFWRVTMIRALIVGREASHDVLAPLLTVAVIANPLVIGLGYAHLRRSQAPPTGLPAAGMLVAAVLSPLVFITLRPVAEDGTFWTALMPVAAAVAGVGAVLLTAFLSDLSRAGADWRRVLSPGLAVITVGTLLLAADIQLSHRGLPVGVRSVLGGHPAFAGQVAKEWDLGDRLRGTLPPGHLHVIAGSRAYALALRARTGPGIIVSDGSRPPAGGLDLGLTPGSWIVLRDPGDGEIEYWRRALPGLELVQVRRHPAWRCYELRAGP